MFSVQTHARTMNVRFALTTTKKGNLFIVDYFVKMKGYADEMLVAGKPMDNEELAFHIYNSLNSEYNPAVTARVEAISIPELYSQLLSFETRLDLQDASGSSAHVANRGGRSIPNNRGSSAHAPAIN